MEEVKLEEDEEDEEESYDGFSVDLSSANREDFELNMDLEKPRVFLCAFGEDLA